MLSLPSRYSQRKSSPADGWKTFLKTLFLNQRSFQAVHDDVHHLGNKNYRQSLRSTVELLEVIPFLGHFPSCVQPVLLGMLCPPTCNLKLKKWTLHGWSPRGRGMLDLFLQTSSGSAAGSNQHWEIKEIMGRIPLSDEWKKRFLPLQTNCRFTERWNWVLKN